jgi:N-acylneuraminate cytidylyltransferase
LAIIPARKGSKGIPQKNTKHLAGIPLLAYTIKSAKKTKLINKLILSSDDDKAIEIAKEYEIEVPFKRPDYLSKDNSGSLEAVQHAVDFYEKRGQYFDAVLLLQPTTPFREEGFIDKAIETFILNNCDALVSVLPVPHQYNPHWVFESDAKGFLKIATGETEIIKRRQDLPKTYFRDGSIYITKRNAIKKGTLYGDKISFIVSNPENHVNIDTLEDWEKAQYIANALSS